MKATHYGLLAAGWLAAGWVAGADEHLPVLRVNGEVYAAGYGWSEQITEDLEIFGRPGLVWF